MTDREWTEKTSISTSVGNRPIAVLTPGGLRMYDITQGKQAIEWAAANLGSVYIRADWVEKTAKPKNGKRLIKHGVAK